MKKPLALAAASLALLGACATPEAPAAPAPAPTVTEAPTATPTPSPEASPCSPADEALVERVAGFVDPETGLVPIPGDAAVFEEGPEAYFVALALSGPGLEREIAVWATPDLASGPVLPASTVAAAFSVPGTATAEAAWGVAPYGGSVEVATECLS